MQIIKQYIGTREITNTYIGLQEIPVQSLGLMNFDRELELFDTLIYTIEESAKAYKISNSDYPTNIFTTSLQLTQVAKLAIISNIVNNLYAQAVGIISDAVVNVVKVSPYSHTITTGGTVNTNNTVSVNKIFTSSKSIASQGAEQITDLNNIIKITTKRVVNFVFQNAYTSQNSAKALKILVISLLKSLSHTFNISATDKIICIKSKNFETINDTFSLSIRSSAKILHIAICGLICDLVNSFRITEKTNVLFIDTIDSDYNIVSNISADQKTRILKISVKSLSDAIEQSSYSVSEKANVIDITTHSLTDLVGISYLSQANINVLKLTKVDLSNDFSSPYNVSASSNVLKIAICAVTDLTGASYIVSATPNVLKIEICGLTGCDAEILNVAETTNILKIAICELINNLTLGYGGTDSVSAIKIEKIDIEQNISSNYTTASDVHTLKIAIINLINEFAGISFSSAATVNSIVIRTNAPSNMDAQNMGITSSASAITNVITNVSQNIDSEATNTNITGGSIIIKIGYTAWDANIFPLGVSTESSANVAKINKLDPPIATSASFPDDIESSVIVQKIDSYSPFITVSGLPTGIIDSTVHIDKVGVNAPATLNTTTDTLSCDADVDILWFHSTSIGNIGASNLNAASNLNVIYANAVIPNHIETETTISAQSSVNIVVIRPWANPYTDENGFLIIPQSWEAYNSQNYLIIT